MMPLLATLAHALRWLISDGLMLVVDWVNRGVLEQTWM